ncbi:MAG: hypothetical protein V1811_03250 [Candidatus Micrarchaeota archaeon]
MKSGKKNAKLRTGGLMLLALVFFLVAITFVLWTFTMGVNAGNPESFLPLLIVLVVLALGYWFFAREREKINSGMPFEDEFSKRVKLNAGFYAFLAGIWFNLILAWAIDDGYISLIPRHALFASIIAMTLVFLGAWLYFNYRGISE